MPVKTVQEQDGLLQAIRATGEYLPYARYNMKIVQFLGDQMKELEHSLAQIQGHDMQEQMYILDVLKEEIDKSALLIKMHAQPFNIRTFLKVNHAKDIVEEICSSFRVCLEDLGSLNASGIRTAVDVMDVNEDKSYMEWMLTCILDGDLGGERLDEETRKNLEVLAYEHKQRMHFVNFKISRDDIIWGKIIGEGSYGVIYEAKWLGHCVAVKKVCVNLSLESRAAFLTEVENHMRLSSPNIVQCYGAVFTQQLNAIVMELATMDLETLLHSKSDAAWPRKVGWMESAASALRDLHASGVVHRDVKPQNFLVFESPGTSIGCVIKIGDFGLAHVKSETRKKTMRAMLGTPLFVAPEIHAGEPHHFRSDVFSFGLVLYEIAATIAPYYGIHTEGGIRRRKEKWLEPCVVDDSCPKDLLDIMKSCIAPDPNSRPTMNKVVSDLHELLNKVGCSAKE